MPGTTDTVKAILTPGEFVIRKEAVDMIGAPMLNMINNMPEKGGHSNIDSLIEKATMSNMKGMYGGGMVQAGPKPMGTGGMVDAYAGGGMVMDQYGHGGKVKKNLKPVPKNNPGLGKLPEAVRNKMGYMQEGGEVQDSLMGMMYGGMANKKKKGYQDGGPIGPPLSPEMMGQAMNQQLNESIDMRMAYPQAGEIGMVRKESEAIEAAMKDNLARNARLALQKMRLDSILSEQGASMQPEALEPRMFIPQELIQGGQSLDIRDYDKSVEKYLESEYGPQNTLRGTLRMMPYLPK
jgi:hypothetical protein